jgi:hypothetical protein
MPYCQEVFLEKLFCQRRLAQQDMSMCRAGFLKSDVVEGVEITVTHREIVYLLIISLPASLVVQIKEMVHRQRQ